MSRLAVVIGGAGFVGRRLAEMLVGPTRDEWPRFDRVHVVDVVPWRGSREVSAGIADVRSRASLREALAGAHTVFHLASIVDVRMRRNPLVDAVNVEGTRNVIAVCRELGVPYLVYTSSEDVVLSETPVAGGDESLPYPERPIHDYVRTKIEGEKLALAANDATLHTCAIRPVHVYGAGDPHAIVTSLRAFAKGTVPFLLGDGSARFDVVYVDNVVHAHLLAAKHLHGEATRERVAGRAFFAGEEHAPNYFDWLRPYAEAKRVKMPKRRLSYRATHALAHAMETAHRATGWEPPFHKFHLRVLAQDFFFRSERAQHDLGYRPIVGHAEARERTIEWLREVSLS